MTPKPELPLRDSDEIQGNILAGFLKDHQTFLFLELPDRNRGRAWLAELVPPRGPSRIASTREVATFNRQFSEARRNRGGDDPEDLKALWVNLGLTESGLERLAPDRRHEWEGFEAFAEGAAARAGRLRDTGASDPSEWVVGHPDQTIDAVLTVAADDIDDLRIELERMRALAARRGAAIVFEEYGATLRGVRAGHEHFGFKDGISQPAVAGFDDGSKPRHGSDELVAAGEFVLGHDREGGEKSWPHPEWMGDGSFQVFRRLGQDVAGWWTQVIRAVGSLPPDDPMTADLLGAKLVGRWRSGTPLARARERDNRSAQDRSLDNDFDYADDGQGHKTPRFAHIRKMYPRDRKFDDKRRRILRRGIPFGRPFDPAGGRGSGVDAERGLLFNVFMASIEQQFEFLQASWANNPNFPVEADGPDPVIGEDAARVRLVREGRDDVELDFRRFVQTTGAVYAFAPSIRTLRDLGSGRLG
jgi:Dyp-type peroxidase family